MGKLADKLRKAIEDSGMTDDVLAGVYDAVEKMSDKDVHEYLYSSAPYFKQMIPMAVNEIEPLKQMVMTEPQWGVMPESYAKLFGKDMSEEDFLRNVDKIPTDEMQYVAETRGLDFKEMLNDIRERQTAQLRKDIAEGYGEDLGGKIANKITNLVAPQSMKAVYEGRDPSTGEVVGDVVTNASYVVPWGRAINNPVVKGIVGNATAPVIAETADVLVGDEDKSTGERLANIGTGALINFTTPHVLGGIASKFPGGKYVASKMEQKSANEIANETKRALNKQASITRTALQKSGKGDVRNMTAAEYNIHKQIKPQEVLKQTNDMTVKSGTREVLIGSSLGENMYNIAKQPGNTFNKKLANANKETKEWFKKLPEKVKDKVAGQTLNVYGDAFNAGGGVIGDMTSYGTNKFGDWFYDGDISKIRGVGMVANKLGLVESNVEKARRLRQEELEHNKQIAIENLRTRGLLMGDR